MTVADLQKIADEITAAYGDKPWRVELNDNQSEFLTAYGGNRSISAGRKWMENPDLRAMRFQVAMQCAVWNFKRRTLYYRIETPLTLTTAILLLTLFFGAIAKPYLLRWLLATVFIPRMFSLAAQGYADKLVVSESRSEPFMRKLLEVTKDPDSLRDELRNLNAPPEAFHTLDHVIVEMGLETTHPT